MLSISRIMKMFSDPKGLIFLALVTFLLFAGDPNNLRSVLGGPLALLAWTCAVGLYVVMLFVLMSLFSFTQDRFGPYPIYTPLTSSIGMFVVFLIVKTTLVYLTGGRFPSQNFPLFFNLMGAGLAIETLFIRFVLPSVFAEPDLDEEDKPALLKVGDRQLPLQKIFYMASQEHYISIATPSETLMVRARLVDMVAQTSEEHGLQPHRSWWVSAAAQPKLKKQDGKSVLTLSDGTAVPVAKARQTDVQNWLDLHADW